MINQNCFFWIRVLEFLLLTSFIHVFITDNAMTFNEEMNQALGMLRCCCQCLIAVFFFFLLPPLPCHCFHGKVVTVVSLVPVFLCFQTLNLIMKITSALVYSLPGWTESFMGRTETPRAPGQMQIFEKILVLSKLAGQLGRGPQKCWSPGHCPMLIGSVNPCSLLVNSNFSVEAKVSQQ